MRRRRREEPGHDSNRPLAGPGPVAISPCVLRHDSREIRAIEGTGAGIYNVVDDDPAPVGTWLPRYAELPELPREWARQKAALYRGKHAEIVEHVHEEFKRAPATSNRGEFAAWAKTTRYPGLLFRLLDGKSIDAETWKLIEPAWERPAWVEKIEEG